MFMFISSNLMPKRLSPSFYWAQVDDSAVPTLECSWPLRVFLVLEFQVVVLERNLLRRKKAHLSLPKFICQEI